MKATSVAFAVHLSFLIAVSVSQDTLSLDDALAEARQRRPRAAVAAGLVAQAHGTSRTLGIVPNPVFQYDGYDAAPAYKVYLSQSLSWLFRHGADRAVGRSLVERARADSAILIAELGREVRRAFTASLARRQQLEIASEQRAIADSLVRIAERRLAVGDISDLERDQVDQERARARQLESLAQEAHLVAVVGLARALGRIDSLPVVASGWLDDALGRAWSVDAPPVPPFLAGALADSAAAAARLRSSRLAQVPPVSLRTGQESGGDGFDRKVFIGFSVAVPIFSRGREAVAEAAGADIIARNLAAEARLELAARRQEVAIRLDQAERRAVIARDSLTPRARRIRAGAVRLYDMGRTGIIPVFDALRTERDAQRDLIGALVDFQNARADLLALYGRWQ